MHHCLSPTYPSQPAYQQWWWKIRYNHGSNVWSKSKRFWQQTQLCHANSLNRSSWLFVYLYSVSQLRQIAQDTRPDIHYTITVQQAITDQAYRKKIEQSDEYSNNEDFGWYPECISNKNWQAFFKNPFHTDILTGYTKQMSECKSKNDRRVTMRPLFLILFKHMTRDTGTASTTKQRTIDVCNMNAYQIIPGIMYTLLVRLWGVMRATILNESAAKKAINFVPRYCYVTRAQPFNTIHRACTEYGIKPKLYLNQCEGEDEALPVTVLLVAMYNSC